MEVPNKRINSVLNNGLSEACRAQPDRVALVVSFECVIITPLNKFLSRVSRTHPFAFIRMHEPRPDLLMIFVSAVCSSIFNTPPAVAFI